MKKVFPLIVVLITISVLGIIFIQMSWIRNAVSLRQKQHQQDIEHAVSDIKMELYQLYILSTGNMGFISEDSRQFLLRDFTTQYLDRKDIDNIVDKAFKKYNVDEPTEYTILNIFQSALVSSDGYKPEYFSHSIAIPLQVESARTPEMMYIYLREDPNSILHSMGWMIGASIFFTTIIISAFALTVRTMFTQKKLSEIKSDFINNMTHELKTPLATISLAIDALTNEKVIHDTDKIKYYSAMIKDENKRMNKQVEKILQAARIEKQDIKLNLQELNAHDIINKVANNLALQIQEKNGVLNLDLHARNKEILADEVHFSNIVFNLLDNAIKYSKDNLAITIETENTGGMLAIKVKDNGIGMNRETANRVFEKFYRAHTGNVHNVKGFGLGLSYVKAMVEEHGGKAKVESAVGKGSTFIVTFPLT